MHLVLEIISHGNVESILVRRIQGQILNISRDVPSDTGNDAAEIAVPRGAGTGRNSAWGEQSSRQDRAGAEGARQSLGNKSSPTESEKTRKFASV